MRESLFSQFTNSLMKGLTKLIELVNEKRSKKITYLHKTMLRKEFSPDQKWDSASVNTNYVAADMVAMDSPLPIKKRHSVSVASGTLPKIGMKKVLKESLLNSLENLAAQRAVATTDAQKLSIWQRIAKILTDDPVACNIGIDEKNEYNFLYGLSHGLVLIQDADNTGTGLRVNFGYLPANKFGVTTKGVVSEEDLQRVFSKADADGNAIGYLMMSKNMYNKIRGERWAREMCADYQQQTFDSNSTLRKPGSTLFNEAMKDNYGVELIVTDRTVLIEKNGKDVPVKPWDDNAIVFLTTDQVGALVWGELVEARRPVDGVDYAIVEEYKLIKKYSTTEPAYQEITAGEAMCLPVIEGVDAIYTLDASNATEVDETKEAADTTDEKITLNGKTYTKSAVIAALKELGDTFKTENPADSTVISHINQLSDEDEAKLLKAIESVQV